jgi:hypothetical protein
VGPTGQPKGLAVTGLVEAVGVAGGLVVGAAEKAKVTTGGLFPCFLATQKHIRFRRPDSLSTASHRQPLWPLRFGLRTVLKEPMNDTDNLGWERDPFELLLRLQSAIKELGGGGKLSDRMTQQPSTLLAIMSVIFRSAYDQYSPELWMRGAVRGRT